jgi:hypothetical protein
VYVFGQIENPRLTDQAICSQAAYYSDYCLYGVEKASKEDYDSNRQPGENDVGVDGGEKWFYRNYYKGKGGGGQREFVCHVRYRLRVTEDQRQICTAKGLRYGIINDDCETGASAQLAEKKTGDCIKIDMIDKGVIDDGSVVRESGAVEATTMQERFENLLGKLLGHVTKKTGDNIRRSPTQTTVVETTARESDAGGEDDYDDSGLDQIIRAVEQATGGFTRDHVYLYMAVANILRQFDFAMDLCIGTANAAAVGAAAQLSGHCFAICAGHHHTTGDTIPMIVEVRQCVAGWRARSRSTDAFGTTRIQGTRWVMQERCLPKAKRLLTDVTGNMLNEISSVLMEMTKLGSMDVLLDAGVGLMRYVPRHFALRSG